MKTILKLLPILILITSCINTNNKSRLIHRNLKDSITINNVKIDTLNLKIKDSSYDGTIIFNNDTLIFVDQYFGYLYEFDKDGKYISKKFGQGPGPKEINTGHIDLSCKIKDSYIFIGPSNDVHIHNNEGIRKNTFNFTWNFIGIRNKNELINYELNYGDLYGIIYNDRYMYLPTFAYTKNLNPSNSDYIKRRKLFVKIDFKKKKIIDLVGKFPETYRKNSQYPQYHGFYLDIDSSKNDFYMSYELDSLIYKYNNKFQLKEIFGKKGKDLRTDYSKIKTYNINRLKNIYFNEKKKKGYYTNIKHIKELDYLVRIYHKNENNNGLQIYHNGRLIGDIKISKDINKICGYIKPYLYSNAICNDEKETLKIIRLKI